jgi:hypothetical protein
MFFVDVGAGAVVVLDLLLLLLLVSDAVLPIFNVLATSSSPLTLDNCSRAIFDAGLGSCIVSNSRLGFGGVLVRIIREVSLSIG